MKYLIAIVKHPEHGKRYIWQNTKAGYDYTVTTGTKDKGRRILDSSDYIIETLICEGFVLEN